MHRWRLTALLAIIATAFIWWLRNRTQNVFTPQKQFNTVTEKTETTRDSLSEINGIGQTFEQALNAIGIFTFSQLAKQDPQQLAQNMAARITADRIIRDQWIEQARELSKNTD